jgi:hypothetical protein
MLGSAVTPVMTMEMMTPYRAMASAKIIIRMRETKSLSCCPTALTPASPTIPMVIPAAKLLRPQHNPAARWANPRKEGYLGMAEAELGLPAGARSLTEGGGREGGRKG